MTWTNVDKPTSGAELVTNGSLAQNANGWTLDFAVWNAGKLVYDPIHDLLEFGQILNAVNNVDYLVSFDIVVTSGAETVQFCDDGIFELNTTQTFSQTITAHTSVVNGIYFSTTSSFQGSITNISVTTDDVTWTNVNKPTTENFTNINKPVNGFSLLRGMATGLIAPPTYSVNRTFGGSWTKISKPT